MDRFVRIRSLGSGTFGAVYLVKELETNRQFALKEVRLDEKSKHRTKAAVLKEAQILSRLKHPNIVAYKDSFFDDAEENLYIVQDFCDGGSLDDKIVAASKKEESFKEKQILQWFVQILMAVHYIHTQKILHRDLKTQNVFMNRRGNTCKLGDFGISKTMSGTIDLASTCVGTPAYFAPEMCQDLPYSSKADIWALGCILYELCALHSPFEASNIVTLIFKIVKGPLEPIPSFYSTELSDLVKMVLSKRPDNRPSAQQILNLAFVKSVLSEFIEVRQQTGSPTTTEEAVVVRQKKSKKAKSVIQTNDTRTKLSKLVQATDLPPCPRRYCGRLPSLTDEDFSHRAGKQSYNENSNKATKQCSSEDKMVVAKQCTSSIKKNNTVSEAAAHVTPCKAPVVCSESGTEVEYEDDFEQDDDDDDDSVCHKAGKDKKGKEEDQYYDDFEDSSSDEELESIKSRAREVHDFDWNFYDDVTIVDEDFVGPIDIRKLLSPEAAELMKNSTAGSSTSSRWSIGGANKESCYLVEDLLGNSNE